MATTIVNKILVREATAIADNGTATTPTTAISIDLTSYHGKDFGATGRYATGTIEVLFAGSIQSGFVRKRGRFIIFLARDNGGTPTITVTEDASSEVGGQATIDISGSTLRIRVATGYTLNNPFAWLVEANGVLFDFSL